MAIPFENTESAKALIGKTLELKDGRQLKVEKWEGDNFVISEISTGNQGEYPIMFILDHVCRKNFVVIN